MSQENQKNPLESLELNKKIKRRNFISFSTFLLVGGAGLFSLKKLFEAPIEAEGGITSGTRIPLRKTLNNNESFFRKFFSHEHLVKTYPKSMAAKNVRVNSDIGIEDKDYPVQKWKLQIHKSNQEVLELSMDQIKSLPKTEIIFDFKCVEGWDQIQHWGGVKFIDLIDHLGLKELLKHDYVGMETPNQEYYVGLDMESATHPQTILAYEMNGLPITMAHGAPLRLIVPVKYGIKNIKRIGSISFSNQRPKDYWAEQGYDYYSGL